MKKALRWIREISRSMYVASLLNKRQYKNHSLKATFDALILSQPAFMLDFFHLPEILLKA